MTDRSTSWRTSLRFGAAALVGLSVGATAQQPAQQSAPRPANPPVTVPLRPAAPEALPGAPSVPALAAVEIEIFAPAGTPLPRFAVDAAWPNMPADLMVGQVSGVAVDRDNEVWIAHRPHSLTNTDNGRAQNPPIAVCCRPAPTILRFSQDGRYLGGFGGADSAPTIEGVNQWPASVHGLFVDADKTVWFGGNGDGDHAVLNYTADGRFIRQFGRRTRTGGNTDQALLGNPADVFHDHGQTLIADGYINKRVIRFGANGAFTGFWGAYGTPPAGPSRDGHFDQSQATSTTDGGANPASRSFGDIVHCVVPTGDGHVYVCDRRNNRAQLFRQARDGSLTHVRDIVIAPETGGTRTVTDIALSPDGRFIYVADMMNGRIWILDRRTHAPLAAIGRNGRQAGQFTWLHSIAVDSAGNLYTTEVSTGRRVQKFVLTGVS